MGPDRRIQDHLDQARLNEAFLGLLVSDILPDHPEYAGWAMVVMHYAALHYTQTAILRDYGQIAYTHRGWRDELGGNHPGHNDLVRAHFPQEVVTAYLELFDRSQEARYRPYHKRPLDALAQVNLQSLLLDTVKAACGY